VTSIMSLAHRTDLELALELADIADEITLAGFRPGGSVEHERKPDGSPVSPYDVAAEQAILSALGTHRPQDAMLGEEVGSHGRARRRWIVDGIDGTAMFVRGDPLWGTLIALVEDGIPTVGVCSSPAQAARWWASPGEGAWARSGHGAPLERLRVAGEPGRPLRVNVELANDGHPLKPSLDRLAHDTVTVPMRAHPAIMVARGEVDVVVHPDGGPWDVAALMPIVWEAGGGCFHLDGDACRTPERPMVYAGNVPADELQALLAPLARPAVCPSEPEQEDDGQRW
jgi:histidinol-phosphatase